MGTTKVSISLLVLKESGEHEDTMLCQCISSFIFIKTLHLVVEFNDSKENQVFKNQNPK